MLYIINWVLFLVVNACGHFANRWAVIAAVMATFGWMTNEQWVLFVAIIVVTIMVMNGVINAVMTIVAMALQIRTVTHAEEDMVRARRQGDGPAYDWARRDKMNAINSLIGLMSELATWTQVGFEFNVAVASLREQVRDNGRNTVRW